MKTFTFTSNVVAAVVLSIGGAAVHSVLLPLLGHSDAVRVVLLLVSLSYLLYVLHRNAPRFGMSLMLSGWLLNALFLLLFNPPLAYWLLMQVLVLWLIRSALRYQRLHHFITDAAISLLALCCGISAMLYTRSVLLGLWSYFLVQAFCAWIPARHILPVPAAELMSRFSQAQSSAEHALRRMRNNA